MVMRGDNIRQRSHLMCTASYISVYTQRDIAVHANDNCEHISSMVGRTWAEGSYAYTYDALNRLESAVFTPAEGLADRPGIERGRIPDFSVYYCYDLEGGHRQFQYMLWMQMPLNKKGSLQVFIEYSLTEGLIRLSVQREELK